MIFKVFVLHPPHGAPPWGPTWLPRGGAGATASGKGTFKFVLFHFPGQDFTSAIASNTIATPSISKPWKKRCDLLGCFSWIVAWGKKNWFGQSLSSISDLINFWLTLIPFYRQHTAKNIPIYPLFTKKKKLHRIFIFCFNLNSGEKSLA